MLTEADVRALMADMESDRIERTISFREDKLGAAVCAFANDLPNHRQPGYVLLGVDDKTGQATGMTIGDEQLQQLGNLRSNGNILPQPYLVVSPVYHFDEGDVVVLAVHPADFPPVRFRGRVYIRVGPRQGIATPQEERALAEKRIYTARTFDEQSYPGSGLPDLNTEAFLLSYLPKAIDAETLAENGRAPKEQLASLGFYDLVREQCTHAGILMFGKNPQRHIPGAYVQYVKFDSEAREVEAVQAEKVFTGPLVDQLKNIDEFVQVNIVKQRPVPIKPNGFREQQVYNYPTWALRELVMNAVMHRDYESNAPIYVYEFSDRVEIVNPGGLYGDVRPENFPHTSDYRNPILALAMKNLGYVNKFNFGIQNAQAKLKENGNPPAVFDLAIATKFKVTIWINAQWLR